jgi:hypothetical protein
MRQVDTSSGNKETGVFRGGTLVVALALVGPLGCSPRLKEPHALVWHVPWETGQRFELVRVERALVRTSALGVDDKGLLSQFGWDRRIEFHGRVTAVEGDKVCMELIVAKARVDATMGEGKSSTEFVRGQGQKNLATGASEEVDADWSRIYRFKMNRQGMMVDWEGRLDAMDLLHGLGGEYYNVFTALLREFPQRPIHPGAEWKISTAVKLAHCDSIPLELFCKLEGVKHREGRAGYLVSCSLSLGQNASDRLKQAGLKDGTASWWIGEDLKEIRGTLRFQIRDGTGAPMVEWLDEVDLRPGGS